MHEETETGKSFSFFSEGPIPQYSRQEIVRKNEQSKF